MDSDGENPLEALLSLFGTNLPDVVKEIAEQKVEIHIKGTGGNVQAELKGNTIALLDCLVDSIAHVIAGCPFEHLRESIIASTHEIMDKRIKKYLDDEKK